MTAAAPADAGAQSSAQGVQPAQSSAPPETKPASLIPSPGPAAEPAAPAVERPEWCPEKFWDAKAGAPNIEQLAKGHRHLESRLGAFKGAPEPGEDGKVRYALNLPEGVEGLDPKELAEDPLWLDIQDELAAANASQEFADKLAAKFFVGQAKANHINKEAEMMRLRRDGWSDARLRSFGDFWAGQCDTNEEFQDIQALCTTAQGVLTLERIRNRMLSTKLMPSAQTASPASADELSVQFDRGLEELAKLSEGSAEFRAKRAEVDAIRERMIAVRGR